MPPRWSQRSSINVIARGFGGRRKFGADEHAPHASRAAQATTLQPSTAWIRKWGEIICVTETLEEPAAWSVRHQHWNGHRFQECARHAAQD